MRHVEADALARWARPRDQTRLTDVLCLNEDAFKFGTLSLLLSRRYSVVCRIQSQLFDDL